MKIIFEKLQVCQSDFLVCANHAFEHKAKLTQQLCARRTGIGADGAIFITKQVQNKAYAEFYNADGTSAYMCESAAKACAQSLFSNKIIRGSLAEISTKSGRCQIERLSHGILQSNLSLQSFAPKKIAPLKSEMPLINSLCEVCGGGVYITAVYSGMPFAAVLNDNLNGINLAERGVSFQGSRSFQKGINLVFIQIVDKTTLRLRVYRHGCGEVPSCGSAAMAAHAAASRLGLCSKEQITAISEGGVLTAFINKRSAGVLSVVNKIAEFKIDTNNY